MWRLTLATALAHRARLALTVLAVALGVAFVAGSLILTDTSTRLLDAQFRSAAAGVDITVRSAAAFDAAMGVQVQRDPLPPSLAGRIAATPGVAAVHPVATGPGQLQTAGAVVRPNGPTVVGYWDETPFTAYKLRAGHAPHGPGEVVLDVATARRHGVTLGDTVTISATGSRRLQVVGLTGVGDGDGMANTALALVDLPTAQGLLGLGTGISSVDVIAADGTDVTGLRERLAGVLGPDYAVTGAQDAAAASADAAAQSIDYLRIVLLALAAAGLVVGGFLIANTFGMVLSQRSRELALLRAAGATGRQVFGSVLGEALLVGITGAVGGTGLGIGGAYGLRGLAQQAGLALPDGPLSITGSSLLIAVLAGTAVTVLAALGPARRAARVAPVTAMRAADPASSGPRRGRSVTGGVLAGVGLAVLGAAVVLRDVAVVALGAVLLLAGLVMLAPALTPRLALAVGRPVGLGVPGRLAREAVVRNPRRTASTAMALGLGLALIAFVSVLGASVRAIAAAGSEAVTADLLIQSSRAEMLGGLSPEVAVRAAAVPQVEAVTPIRFGHWLDGGMTSVLTAVDPSGLPGAARITMTEGSLAALDGGGVVVADTVARERSLSVGDALSMTFPRDGTQQVRVVGIISDDSARALSTSYLISLTGYAQHYSENVDATVFVTLGADADQQAARAALQAAVADFPNAEILDQAQAAAARAGAIDQVLGLITVLLGFAVLIALLGITNTLALSIVERTREIGLLRAVGMTRAQLRSMVRAEAVLIAAVAVVAGVALGLVLGSATLAGLAADGPLVIRVPILQLLLIAAGAVAAGLAAGLLPARRAARLDVLTAIAAQ